MLRGACPPPQNSSDQYYCSRALTPRMQGLDSDQPGLTLAPSSSFIALTGTNLPATYGGNGPPCILISKPLTLYNNCAHSERGI